MIESWVVNDGSAAPVSSAVVQETLRARIDKGKLETWLTSSSGRSLAIVTNTERAMVMLLDREGGSSRHAADPGACGSSKVFVLTNGQHDEYPNEDTAPTGEAFKIVDHIISNGSWPADAPWVSDLRSESCCRAQMRMTAR